MQLHFTRSGPILHQHAIKSTIVGLPHRRRYANISRDPRNDQVPDSPDAQQQLEIRMGKGAPARFIDHRFALPRIQFGDRVVALLAADEQATERARVADAEAGGVVPGAEALAGGEGGEVGAVAFAGVVDLDAGVAAGVEQVLETGDDGAGGGDGVALGFEVAAGRADCGVVVALSA